MPNHVTQRLVITGPQEIVERFRKVHFTNGDEAEVAGELEKAQQNLVKVKAGEKIDGWYQPSPEFLGKMIEQLEAQLVEIRSGVPGRFFSFDSFVAAPPFISEGALSMEDRTANNRNWYFHNTTRWGTKWGAYDCDVKEVELLENGNASFEFRFDTAWSIPEPIYAIMALAWPELRIEVGYVDEGWCFWGVSVLQDYKLEDRCYSDYRTDSEAFQILMWLERVVRQRTDEDLAESFEGDELLELAGTSEIALIGVDSPFVNN